MNEQKPQQNGEMRRSALAPGGAAGGATGGAATGATGSGSGGGLLIVVVDCSFDASASVGASSPSSLLIVSLQTAMVLIRYNTTSYETLLANYRRATILVYSRPLI